VSLHIYFQPRITDYKSSKANWNPDLLPLIQKRKHIFLLKNKPPLSYFVPTTCDDPTNLGDFCNASAKPCDVLKPCRNSGNCTNDSRRPHRYSCLCEPGYNGTNCEFDIRLCKSNTCLHNGTSVPDHSKWRFILFWAPAKNWIIQTFIVIVHEDIRVSTVNIWLTTVTIWHALIMASVDRNFSITNVNVYLALQDVNVKMCQQIFSFINMFQKVLHTLLSSS
jgi:hypothetical protein